MAAPHLISVPISPFCVACGWEFAQNQAVEGAVNKFCGSCGLDLTMQQFADTGDSVPANLLPGVVTSITSIANTSVSFFFALNTADTSEIRARVNGGAWGAPVGAVSPHVQVGSTGDVIDIELRSSMTGPPVVVGAWSPVSTGVVA